MKAAAPPDAKVCRLACNFHVSSRVGARRRRCVNAALCNFREHGFQPVRVSTEQGLFSDGGLWFAQEDAAFAGLKGRELNGRSRQEGLSPCTDSGGGTEVPPHDGASAAQQQGKTEQQQLDEMLGLDADDSPAKDWLDHEADSSASRGGELESDRESENSGEEEASDYLGEFHTAADVSKAVSACQADIQGGASSPPAAASPAELPKPLDLRPLPIEDMSSIPPAERNMWILHNQVG